MTVTFLMVIVALLVVLIIVVAYNMHQENQYRKKIRNQFGHSDHDALMNVHASSVRDGQNFGFDGVRQTSIFHSTTPLTDTPIEEELPQQPETEPQAHIDAQLAQTVTEQPENQAETAAAETASSETISEPDLPTEHESAKTAEVEPSPAPEKATDSWAEPVFELTAPTQEKPKRLSKTAFVFNQSAHLDMDGQLEELARNQLNWFDKRFDFMAYVALRQARELQAIPRLSMRQRFQIIGCTRDGRFQAAEPIPGVMYQAFVIGLQGISRSGLVEKNELLHFSEQVHLFAERMDGRARMESIDDFLAQAEPLDELCARVDQTIAIHLVSQTNILGEQLRQTLDKHGFELQHEGVFTYASSTGEVLYTLASLDGQPFTEALLASQAYKGFSMLFDITRIPDGEINFNSFMSLAVKLSSELSLDLVDAQLQPLSTDWLKEVRNYVGVLQQDMESIGVKPASNLAKRLFA